MPSSQLIAVVVDLDHVAEVTVVRFVHCGLTPLLFPSCPRWEEALVHSLPKDWGVRLHLLDLGASM